MSKLHVFILLIILLVGAIAVNEIKFDGNVSQSPPAEVEKIEVFKEGVHYTKVESHKISEILKKLNIKEGETFELFSYTCPACFGFEHILGNVESKFEMKIKKLQLGFPDVPMGQVDYILNEKLTGQALTAARVVLYQTMLKNGTSIEDKILALRGFPLKVGISEADSLALKERAEEYNTLTMELAEALNLKGTPSLYFKGKFIINRGAVGSIDNLYALIEHLSKIN